MRLRRKKDQSSCPRMRWKVNIPFDHTWMEDRVIWKKICVIRQDPSRVLELDDDDELFQDERLNSEAIVENMCKYL